jgi:phospholipase/carboxylesterase
MSMISGLHPLGLGGDRDGVLYIPKSVNRQVPAPLALMLHGAESRSRAMEFALPLADEFGVVILAPDSRAGTWDAVTGEYGPDVQFIDDALTFAFERCLVDPKGVAIAGFSDGASYALALGAANGDLFSSVVAFSPGVLLAVNRIDRPRMFVAHGLRDAVLPIDSARFIVVQLKRYGYSVTFREFDGPHEIPPTVARDAFAWLVM